MKTKIKPIVWNHHDSQFGKVWISDLPNMDCRYSIWIERDTGRTKVSAINRQHHYFNSIDDAKDWCQKDFEKIINNLIQ